METKPKKQDKMPENPTPNDQVQLNIETVTPDSVSSEPSITNKESDIPYRELEPDLEEERAPENTEELHDVKTGEASKDNRIGEDAKDIEKDDPKDEIETVSP